MRYVRFFGMLITLIGLMLLFGASKTSGTQQTTTPVEDESEQDIVIPISGYDEARRVTGLALSMCWMQNQKIARDKDAQFFIDCVVQNLRTWTVLEVRTDEEGVPAGDSN